MSNQPEWLPPLVLLTEHGGDWERYLAAIYAWFMQDFVEKKPVFRGRPIGLKRHPMSYGKEATFWHMVSVGQVEADREIDLRRCERIRWPSPVIEHSTDNVVKVWENVRTTKKGPENRICLWMEAQEYLVILADRKEYLLPWTAFVVDRSHQKAKLQREFDEYWKNRG
jgi:hypothetical protein